MHEMYDIAIVGGGAAGLTAAIAAGQAANERGARRAIAIFEQDDRVGRSILATGNGRCNFSNATILWGEYQNGVFVQQVFDALAALEQSQTTNFFWPDEPSGDPVLDFFESIGLEWRQESDGRRYPLANKASVVLDVLRAAAAHLDVQEHCGRKVCAIEHPQKPGGSFTLVMDDGEFVRTQRVIVACGGLGASKIQINGLVHGGVVPVLGPLRCSEPSRSITRELDNIRVRCNVLLMRQSNDELTCIGSEEGELLFRSYGVSGICVYNLSRKARPGDVLSINFLKIDNVDCAQDYLIQRYDELMRRYGNSITYGQFLRGLVLPRISESILKVAGLRIEDTCYPDNLALLASLLHSFELEIEGIGDAKQCQVHRGGFAPTCVKPSSLQVIDVPGLYLAGEAFDVDGPCGGYNLHWAWASGLLAGYSAAESIV